jgi:diguanylate cyclase (GGDEF)-like protein
MPRDVWGTYLLGAPVVAADAPTMSLRNARTRVGLTALACLVAGACPTWVLVHDRGQTGSLRAISAIAVVAAVAVYAGAYRARGRVRLAWAMLATALVMMSVLEIMHSFPGLRTAPATQLTNWLAVGLAASAAIAMPGATRTIRGWLLLILDGWLVGGSVFVILSTWSQFTGHGLSELVDHLPSLTQVPEFLWLPFTSDPAQVLIPGPTTTGAGPSVAWLLFDLVLACIVFGLTRQVPRARRTSSLALSFGAAALAGSDLFRSFMYNPSADSIQGGYLVCLFLVAGFTGVAPWLGVHDPYAGTPTEWVARAGQRAVRVPYVVAFIAIMIGFVGLARPAFLDRTLLFTMMALMISMAISQVILAAVNSRLYQRVSTQADDFRIQATRDSLTGLPNRRDFTGRVQHVLEQGESGRVAVLFIDLDGFKDVNDSLGHAVGDELLKQTSQRLSIEVRDQDVVARFGGDEFVALLVDCGTEQALTIAERLRESLAVPYLLNEREVVVSASIGLARPGHTDDADSTLRNADLALYSAKVAGRDRVAVYEPDMHVSALRRLDTAARLRRALLDKTLSLAYQPVANLETGHLRGMEALLRFTGTDLEGFDVAEVIVIAEESGLVVQLGRWVIDMAIAQLGEWIRMGCILRVAVNASARQLENGDLCDDIQAALDRHGVPADLVVLEITEHQLVRDLESSVRELSRLRSMGVRIILDDFGTGYSSLSYLPRLPLDGLKIDKDLVRRIGGERDTVPAVLILGRDLGLTVVAEGIETVQQLVLLRAAGCELGQGYLLGRPMTSDAATRFVLAGNVPAVLALIAATDPIHPAQTLLWADS